MMEESAVETEAATPAPPRWKVTIYQLLFGAMAVGLGGLISAEPTLSLERQNDGRLECRYALNAYGRIPTLRYAVDDLVRYEVTESEWSGPRGDSSGSGHSSVSYNLVLWDRDGSSFAVGQSWSLLDLDGMIERRNDEPSRQQKVSAGRARRYGGLALGAFGLLLLAGALWNVFLMATGLGSPGERVAQG